MVSEWDEYGVLTPFTVLWFDENQVCAYKSSEICAFIGHLVRQWKHVQVTQVKAFPRDCTNAMQIGCGTKKAKRLHPARQAFYLKNNLPFKSKLVCPQQICLSFPCLDEPMYHWR